MAQSYTTDSGTFVIPGVYPEVSVKSSDVSPSTTGVLMLVGEAAQGPAFSEEEDLSKNMFGADELSLVQAKYGSGPLVDAVKAGGSPSNDPLIQGAPQAFILVKTNKGTKASSALKLPDGSDYGVSLVSKNQGKTGNLIYRTISQATAEAVPTTGNFTALVPYGSINASVRVNGGAAQSLSLASGDTPSDFVTAINTLTGVTATGGADRDVLSAVTGSVALTVVSGNSVEIDYTTSWATVPGVGDTLYIPSGSVLAGTSSANVGSYVVTGATSTTITAQKLMDAGVTEFSLTAPVAVSSASVVAVTDVQVFAPVKISLASGSSLAGVGKSLEIEALTSGTDTLTNICYALNTLKVTWLSSAAAPVSLSSGAEYAIKLEVNRQKDNISESYTVGGEVALLCGYKGTTGSLTISNGVLTTTVTGGSGANLSFKLDDFPTIKDLATVISSNTGYSAKPANAILGNLPSTALDQVAAVGIGSDTGSMPGRIKDDAYRLFQKLSDSAVVQLQNSTGAVVAAPAGLPDVANVSFLSGGSIGSTSDADIVNAVAALEKVTGNFLVPLFSRDAGADAIDGLTDSGSTYTIANVHSVCSSHVTEMSKMKRKRNRQAFLSMKDKFSVVSTTAANTANYRCAFAFQDVKVVGASGLAQFQPWMASVLAASMQAAGRYQALVNKTVNISGALQVAGDFNPGDDTQLETALKSGLLPLNQNDTGGWYWASDQTTYGRDNNFVYNSVQAVYDADTVALTLSRNLPVGRSPADFDAALCLTLLETVLDKLLADKWISVSDDAPKGWRNAKVKLAGKAMSVGVEVKLASAIYFIPLNILVSQVEQSAQG